MNKMVTPIIRSARLGEEDKIHNAHMRSIREICIKDHGEDEVKGWGYRPLADRWTEAIKNEFVLVVEYKNEIHGVGHFRVIDKDGEGYGYLHALYFTPEVTGLGLAKQVLQQIFDEAKRHRVAVIKLDSSITALDFYKKFGFVANGDMKKVEIGGYPVTCYPMVRSDFFKICE